MRSMIMKTEKVLAAAVLVFRLFVRVRDADGFAQSESYGRDEIM
jgi:hypothetical protein